MSADQHAIQTVERLLEVLDLDAAQARTTEDIFTGSSHPMPSGPHLRGPGARSGSARRGADTSRGPAQCTRCTGTSCVPGMRARESPSRSIGSTTADRSRPRRTQAYQERRADLLDDRLVPGRRSRGGAQPSRCRRAFPARMSSSRTRSGSTGYPKAPRGCSVSERPMCGTSTHRCISPAKMHKCPGKPCGCDCVPPLPDDQRLHRAALALPQRHDDPGIDPAGTHGRLLGAPRAESREPRSRDVVASTRARRRVAALCAGVAECAWGGGGSPPDGSTRATARWSRASHRRS